MGFTYFRCDKRVAYAEAYIIGGNHPAQLACTIKCSAKDYYPTRDPAFEIRSCVIMSIVGQIYFQISDELY